MAEPPAHILIVEKDPLLLKVYAEELTRAGFRTTACGDGRQAWREIQRDRPDAVVAEQSIEGLRVRELFRRMRNLPDGLGVPLILLSSGVKDVSHPGDAIVHYDADFYFQKPFASDQLVFKVQELLAGFRPAGLVEKSGEVQWGQRAVGRPSDVPLRSGDLADEDLASLVFHFYLHHNTGKLLLIDGTIVRQLYFHRGWPVFAESNVPEESLGRYLVRLGKVTAEQVEEGENAWQEIDRPFGVVLIAEGLVGAADLLRARRANVLRVIDNAFAMETGTYYLEKSELNEAPETASIRECPAELVMHGIAHRYNRDRVKALLKSCEGMLTPSPEADHILNELPGGASLREVLEQFRTSLPLRMMLRQSFFTAPRRAEALVLWVLGALVEREVPDDVRKAAEDVARWARSSRRKDKRSQERRRSEAGSEASVSEVPRQRRRTSRSSRSASVATPTGSSRTDASATGGRSSTNPPRSASTATTGGVPVVRPPRSSSGRSSSSRSSSGRSASGRSSSGRSSSGRSSSSRTDSNRTDSSRSSSSRSSSRAGTRKVPTAPPPSAGDHNILAAIAQASAGASYRSGISAMTEGRFGDAVVELHAAVEADPNNADYRQALGRAITENQDATLATIREAVKQLHRAIRIEPQVGEHYHYLGVALMRAGHNEEARVTFKKALEYGGSRAEASQLLLTQLRR